MLPEKMVQIAKHKITVSGTNAQLSCAVSMKWFETYDETGKERRDFPTGFLTIPGLFSAF